jgi:hypothetical protein
MKTTTYIKDFKGYDEAFDWMVMKNQTSVKDTFCVVPGSDDNYSVVDLMTAIELELGYVWATSRLHYTNNPF